MTPVEQQYRRTVNAIAFALLVFFALLFVEQIALYLLPLFASALPEVTYNVMHDLTQGVLYALAFTLPVFFFYRITRGTPLQRPIFLEPKLPRETPLYILFGMSVVSAAAYLNTIMVNVFDYSAFSDEVFGVSETAADYRIALMVFTTAVVPAFVEEFLFRGMVLGNLLPYGRTTAIFGSALLFGIMHQNVGQFFYATAAGVVLGWIYVRTRSVWPGVLVHFCNNFYSVLQTPILQRLPEDTATDILNAVEIAIFLLGAAAGVWLLLSERDRRPEMRRTGAFEVELPASADYAPLEITASRRVRLFFSAPMVVFVTLCVLSMGTVLMVAVFAY